MNQETLEKILVLGFIPDNLDIGELVIYAADKGLLKTNVNQKLAQIIYQQIYKIEVAKMGIDPSTNEWELPASIVKLEYDKPMDAIVLKIGDIAPALIPIVQGIT
jgi:hypothetical protein